MKLYMDYETRSRANIKTQGLYNYAMHPSTEVICLAWAIDDGPVNLWYPPYFSALLKRGAKDSSQLLEINKAIVAADEIEAHNAAFERLITEFVLQRQTGGAIMPIPFLKWRCSAAHAAYLSMPRSLDGLCSALGADQQKDGGGYKLIQALSNPRANGTFCEDPKLLLEMGAYCVQDVKAERGASKMMPAWPASEVRIWQLDQIINDRGVPVDLDAVDKLAVAVAKAKAELLEEIKELADGEIKSTRQVAAALKWLSERGLDLPNLKKQTVLDALTRPDLLDEVVDFLHIRQSEGGSAVSKLKPFRTFSQEDGRARGLFLYHGAGTGRWAGKHIQPHNFPRDKFKDIKDAEGNIITSAEAQVEQVIAGNFFDGCHLVQVSRCLRGMICAKEDEKLTAVDFTGVEARVLAWLAGEHHILQAFREGRDTYKLAAASIYGVTYDQVTGEQRQIGKVAELALGYQGWAGAFLAMAIGYGVKLLDKATRAELAAEWEKGDIIVHPLDPDRFERIKTMFKTADGYVAACEEARAVEIVKPWRANRPATRALWYGLDAAAKQAVGSPGQAFQFAGVKFCVLRGYLFMRLPSGRNLAYYNPGFKDTTDKYGRERRVITFWGVDPKTKAWAEQTTYGGKLVENAVQGLARDLLVEAMFNAELLGYPVVMHVHDEFVTEVPEESAEAHLEIQEQMACVLPAWAEGLPMGAEGWTAKRYKK